MQVRGEVGEDEERERRGPGHGRAEPAVRGLQERDRLAPGGLPHHPVDPREGEGAQRRRQGADGQGVPRHDHEGAGAHVREDPGPYQ